MTVPPPPIHGAPSRGTRVSGGPRESNLNSNDNHNRLSQGTNQTRNLVDAPNQGTTNVSNPISNVVAVVNARMHGGTSPTRGPSIPPVNNVGRAGFSIPKVNNVPRAATGTRGRPSVFTHQTLVVCQENTPRDQLFLGQVQGPEHGPASSPRQILVTPPGESSITPAVPEPTGFARRREPRTNLAIHGNGGPT